MPQFYVKELSVVEKQTLESLFKKHPSHPPRARAHAVLLSAAGHSLNQLSAIFGVYRQTVSSWLHAWEQSGICGLLDKPRSGRPSKIPVEQHSAVLERVQQAPRSLKTVLAQLIEKLQLNIGSSTLKRFCQQAKLCWKRVRKSLKAKRDPEQFAKSQQELAALAQQAAQQQIDLYFFDQAGFTLEPCLPYAWQPIAKTIELPCAKSKRLNVVGFMDKNCAFQSFVFEGSITSAVVIACIDRFAESLRRPTALVIDNAPIHTSDEFTENIERWRQLGLTIVPIAPYSPELNLIEILWRKIKYEWLPFSAYQSFQALKDSLFEILANIGKSYVINFT